MGEIKLDIMISLCGRRKWKCRLRNSACELIKLKLFFAGSEKGKLIALRQKILRVFEPSSISLCPEQRISKKELTFDDIKAVMSFMPILLSNSIKMQLIIL